MPRAVTLRPENPVAGLVPAIHAFLRVDWGISGDVGGRTKPGHGE
jgi:hypothetical protein